MTRQGLWLRVFSGWTFFVWAVLVKNMTTDTEHELAFRLVHVGLAVVSFVLAAGAWPIARKIDRQNRAEAVNRQLVGSASDSH